MEENEIPDFFEERDLFGQIKPKARPLNEIEIPEEPDNFAGKYAGLGVRVLAYVIDALVMFIPFLFIETLVFPHGDQKEHQLEVNLLSWLLWTVYYGLTESSFLQGTFGKKICKIKVIDEKGNRLTFIKASLRFLAQIISVIPLGYGFWVIEKDKKKQGWHDKLVGCYVVSDKKIAE